MENELSKFHDIAILSCSDIEELVDFHVDGELPEYLAERFSNHLSRCEGCRGLVFDIERLIEMARNLDSDPLPQSIRERLRSRLQTECGFEPHTSKLTIVK